MSTVIALPSARCHLVATKLKHDAAVRAVKAFGLAVALERELLLDQDCDTSTLDAAGTLTGNLRRAAVLAVARAGRLSCVVHRDEVGTALGVIADVVEPEDGAPAMVTYFNTALRPLPLTELQARLGGAGDYLDRVGGGLSYDAATADALTWLVELGAAAQATPTA